MEEFINEFEDFYSIIKEKTDIYINKINELVNIISITEEEIRRKQKDTEFLSSLQNTIYNKLSVKFGDELIKAAYTYYKNNMEINIPIIFNNISNDWNNAFDELKNDIEKNKNKFKHSVKAFGLMALLYHNIIISNITNSFFNSIETHQKNEFNYTISYIYNYLFKEVKLANQYIINAISINEDGFNNIINQRKNEINNVFNIIMENITNSKNKALSMNNQNNILEISSNFFNLKNKLEQFITEIDNSLKAKKKKFQQI